LKGRFAYEHHLGYSSCSRYSVVNLSRDFQHVYKNFI
jgi:hypothetical protein